MAKDGFFQPRFFPIDKNDCTCTTGRNCLAEMAGVWIKVGEMVEDGATDDDDDTETSTTTVPNTCSNSNSNQNSADETQSTGLDCDLDDDVPPTTTATTAGPVDLTTTTVENSSNAADRNKSSGDVVKVNEITFPYSTLFKSSGSKSVKMLYEAMCTFIPPDILDKVLYGLYGQVDQQNEDATTSTLESGELSSTSNNETHTEDGNRTVTNIRDIFDDETSSDEESTARSPSQHQQSKNK